MILAPCPWSSRLAPLAIVDGRLESQAGVVALDVPIVVVRGEGEPAEEVERVVGVVKGLGYGNVEVKEG